MVENKFNYEKTMIAATIKWIDGLNFLKNDEKVSLLKFATIAGKRRNELFALYDAVMNKKEIPEDENKLIKYEILNNIHKISCDDIVLNLSEENLKSILATIADLNEDVLPLGSIVTLKNELFNKDSNEDSKFIITHRFLTNNEKNTYFTYGAVIYPIGAIDNEKILHFNSSSIKERIHLGFSDDKDKAFICTMKNELIVKRKMHSINFSTSEERKGFFKEREDI